MPQAKIKNNATSKKIADFIGAAGTSVKKSLLTNFEKSMIIFGAVTHSFGEDGEANGGQPYVAFGKRRPISRSFGRMVACHPSCPP